MNEHGNRPPQGEQEDGKVERKKEEKFYTLEELPKELQGGVLICQKTIEKRRKLIDLYSKELEGGGLSDHEIEKKNESIKWAEYEITENEQLIEEYLSKEMNICNTLLPGYEWEDKEKRIQRSVFGNESALLLRIQPDPDDSEFGAIVTIDPLPGFSVAAGYDVRVLFDTIVDNGLYIVATIKPVVIRVYNRPPKLAKKFYNNSGEKTSKSVIMPAVLFDSVYSTPNPEASHIERQNRGIKPPEIDDLGHQKGLERKGLVVTSSHNLSSNYEENLQTVSDELAELGYNPVDYGLPPAKEKKPELRPESKSVPEPVKPATTGPDGSDEPHYFVGDYPFETKPTRPVEPEPPVVVEEVKPRPEVRFVSGQELENMEKKMILGQMEPNSNRMRELRNQYLKLQQDVTNAKERLREAENSRGAFSKFFGAGMGPVRKAGEDLRVMQGELERFQKMHHLPVEETQSATAGGMGMSTMSAEPTQPQELTYKDMMSGAKPEKPKKRKKGPSDYDSMMGRE